MWVQVSLRTSVTSEDSIIIWTSSNVERDFRARMIQISYLIDKQAK